MGRGDGRPIRARLSALLERTVPGILQAFANHSPHEYVVALDEEVRRDGVTAYPDAAAMWIGLPSVSAPVAPAPASGGSLD